MKYIGILLFVIIQILFLPLAIVGFVIIFYKQFLVSRKHGVSATAIEVLNGRWAMDVFDLRKDEATTKLMWQMPNCSPIGLWLCLFPCYAVYKITGKHLIYPKLVEEGSETLSNLFVTRTMHIDQIIERHQSDAEQFVFMGAGFDTRAYGPLKENVKNIFEVDQVGTQQFKRTQIQEASIENAHVTYVEVDFSEGAWFQTLLDSGYSPDMKTIFLWEGVTLYLSKTDVEVTLQQLKHNTLEDSVLIVDLYTQKFVSGEYTRGMKQSMEVLKITDEEVTFGLDFSSQPEVILDSFIMDQGLFLGEHHFLGNKTKKGAYCAVAEVLFT